ncbi:MULTISPECIES: hypothetical protein [Micromonospora]|uniref:hypothetical protein n=1 Tax=Micromonospora TaxID=1873 RepID=UPI0013153A44|nr:hypothetical protein [Micromonospora sp. BL1]
MRLAMFGFPRRRPSVLAGVRFCDSCARVSTTAQRIDRLHDRARTAAYALTAPR